MTAIRFEHWGRFEKEFDRLKRKFRTLLEDLERLKKVIALDPTGPSQHRTVLHRSEKACIVKGHLYCKTLRRDSLRIIYAYHEDRITLVWIEVYHKAQKANEDRARIAEYLRSLD
jgi:mRNA-degrading endonuclease RelE of RelBE toxin-antitoxin system